MARIAVGSGVSITAINARACASFPPRNPSGVDSAGRGTNTVHIRGSRRFSREISSMADGNITKDAMYGAVAPDDFESMLQLDRYAQRSTAFDKIISATHDHFWDPLDK